MAGTSHDVAGGDPSSTAVRSTLPGAGLPGARAGLPDGPRSITARDLDVVVDPRSPVPPYYQVAVQLELAMARGTLKVGDRLPTLDDLASATGLCRATIRSAVRYLTRRGLVAPRPGNGGNVVSAVACAAPACA